MFSRVLCCIVLLSLVTLVADQTATSQVLLNPVVAPPDPAKLHPVERIPRERFGLVGTLPLDEKDLNSLVYPSATADERAALLEGLSFFTTPHTAAEGLGPPANQKFCQGCHTNSADVLRQEGNVQLVPTVSPASRAARSSTTNFSFTSFDPATGGGRAPDTVDAINNTGKTAAFTLFGDFKPATRAFNALAQFSTGGVQRVRPSLDACLPDRIPLLSEDPNLPSHMAGVDPTTGFRRTTGERAAPPYIGRGLLEAVFDGDIVANVAAEQAPIHTSLGEPRDDEPGDDALAGRANMNTSNQAFVGGHTDVRVGRLGLRAAGPTLTQFMIGGSQGELGFTSPLLPTEPFSFVNAVRPGCVAPNTAPEPNIPESTIISLRALIRFIAPPEFGRALLLLLKSPNPGAPPPNGTREQIVQRGAELFGVDLAAFASRMIPGLKPVGDAHAINQADRKLNCVGCHTPVIATGQLPTPDDVGAAHLNNAWVPLFSDLLVHKMTNIDVERNAPTQRQPFIIQRVDFEGSLAETLDLSRNLADDTLPNQGFACLTEACLPADRLGTSGDEWRTPPLMGLGRIGPPFLHDGRVFLSKESASTTPAGTVYSDSDSVNNPLVVRTLDDAIRAAIELHDLPAPFNAPNQSTQTGGGCPLPSGNTIGDVTETAVDVCPPSDSPNRSQARKVMKRWRSLSESDQQAVIEFLKQL
jgi:CxxC motif-containing protein (DUF1111 family)